MIRKFKCIKELVVDKLDEYEIEIENEVVIIPVDSVWELSKHAHMSDVRLENDDLEWLEIDFQSLKECFVEMNQIVDYRRLMGLRKHIEVEMANLSIPSDDLIEVDEGDIQIIENENTLVIGTDAPLKEYRYLKSLD